MNRNIAIRISASVKMTYLRTLASSWASSTLCARRFPSSCKSNQYVVRQNMGSARTRRRLLSYRSYVLGHEKWD